MLSRKTLYRNQIGFFFLLSCDIILYIIIIIIISHCGTSQTVFPFATDDPSHPPTTIVDTGVRVCACAPRARSTWERRSAAAVNLVKFPVARRRRRCRTHDTATATTTTDSHHSRCHHHRRYRDCRRRHEIPNVIGRPECTIKNGDEKLPTSLADRISRATAFDSGKRLCSSSLVTATVVISGLIIFIIFFIVTVERYDRVVCDFDSYYWINIKNIVTQADSVADILSVRSPPSGGNTVRRVYMCWSAAAAAWSVRFLTENNGGSRLTRLEPAHRMLHRRPLYAQAICWFLIQIRLDTRYLFILHFSLVVRVYWLCGHCG